jgi:deoxyribodipyrimidine photo-lyase
LTLNLQQDWRYGAAHFEETLIDYDVHSNYYGWAASSGMGPAKVLRFDTIKQSK